LKPENWKYVKIGNWFIYATTEIGVKKAKVIETDIKIEYFEPKYKVGYPYGLTAETGVVRIQYDDVKAIANLADLIKFTPARYTRLVKAWNEWQKYKQWSEAYKETFQSLINEFKAK